MPDETLLTTEEAAARLRLSPATLVTARSRASISPQLPFVRVGPGSIRYRASDLDDYITAHIVTPEQTTGENK